MMPNLHITKIIGNSWVIGIAKYNGCVFYTHLD
jgi:hypothetical protein